MKTRITILLLSLFIIVGEFVYFYPVSAQITPSTFSSALIVPATRPQQVITADFNNDQKADIVVVGNNDIALLIGADDGTFSSPITSPWHPPQFSDSAGGEIATDLNSDGNQDIVVGASTSGSLYMALGNGDGTFGDGGGNNTTYYSGGLVVGMSKADFNNDGKTDVADIGLSFGNTNLVIEYGTGNGTFNNNFTFSNSNSNYRSLAVGDINEDGWTDIVTANPSTNNISVFINNGHGFFNSETRYPEGATNGTIGGILLADFNGDEHLDVAGSNYLEGTISVLSGSGNGSFGTPQFYQAGTDPIRVTSADFNNDGSPDIAASSENGAGPASIAILDNSGIGSFSLDSTLNVPGVMGPLATGDFNGDGKKDLVSSFFGASQPNSIAVYLNTTQQDTTPPVVSNMTFSANPKGVSQNSTLSVSATDENGIQRVEYYLNTDPGQGNGTELTNASGDQYSAELGTSLAVGTYQIYVRALDTQGNWSVPISEQLVVTNQIIMVGPAKIWVGLKNSDDVGLKFDLMAEVYSNDTFVTSGQVNSVPGGSSGFGNAKLGAIVFNSFSPVAIPQNSQLKLKLYVRNACVGSGHNSGTARLWFNDSAANSQFGATIDADSSDYYTLDGFLLSTSAGIGPKKMIDVAAGAKCSPFKTFGTWSITL